MSLSSRSQRLLEGARREVQPSPEDLRRVRARLTSSLVSGVADGSSSALLPLLFISLVSAVALGVGAWRLATRAPVEALPAPSPVTVASAPSCPAVECPAVAACPPAPSCPSTPPPRAQVCTPGATSPAAPAPPLSANGLRSLTFTVPSQPSARLQLEVGLLTDARAALDDGRSLDALGHVNKHKELFPTSLFEEERLAIEVVAKCQAGRPELAEDVFHRLLERAPQTTYLARIHDACGAQFGQPESEEDDE